MEEIDKKDIRLLSKEELKAQFISWGEPKYRAVQLYEWIWKKSATGFDEMSNLSKGLRLKLSEHYSFNNIIIDLEQFSDDGTIKTRFRLHDDRLIESVLIPVIKDKRFTVCVSSQVGCSLSCKFCATGKMKRMRNLDPGEIYDQVVKVNAQCLVYFEHPLTNIVYMGMGEPLLNYRHVMESIRLISDPAGLAMSSRRITLSTAGIAKMIKKVAEDQVRCNLALSLHAADDKKRNQIMPINEQNNLEVLKSALLYYQEHSKGKLSFEYIAFKNFNDTIEDAKNLAQFCHGLNNIKINIIEYNPIEGFDMVKSEKDALDTFASFLIKKGIVLTIRRSRGKDIDAACGQLANK